MQITDIVDGITEALSMFELSVSLPIKEHHSLKEWLPSIDVNITELPVMQVRVYVGVCKGCWFFS